jgi:hypothetical protein
LNAGLGSAVANTPLADRFPMDVRNPPMMDDSPAPKFDLEEIVIGPGALAFVVKNRELSQGLGAYQGTKAGAMAVIDPFPERILQESEPRKLRGGRLNGAVPGRRCDPP